MPDLATLYSLHLKIVSGLWGDRNDTPYTSTTTYARFLSYCPRIDPKKDNSLGSSSPPFTDKHELSSPKRFRQRLITFLAKLSSGGFDADYTKEETGAPCTLAPSASAPVSGSQSCPGWDGVCPQKSKPRRPCVRQSYGVCERLSAMRKLRHPSTLVNSICYNISGKTPAALSTKGGAR